MNITSGRVAGDDEIRSADLCIRFGNRTSRISARLRRAGDDLLIFLHGLGCAKQSFDGAFTAEGLRDFSLCSFDFPGHGDSERWHGQDYTMEAYAEVSRLVVDQARAWTRTTSGQVIIVGHSMGGAVGLIAAAEMSTVGHFVSVEGNLVAEDCGLVSRGTADQTAGEFTSTGYEAFCRDLRASTRRDLRSWESWYANADPRAVHQCARSLVEWCDSGKLLELFQGMSQPTAYVHGDEEDKSHLVSRLRNCRVRRITGAGHFPMIDEPARFYTTLAGLLPAPRRRGTGRWMSLTTPPRFWWRAGQGTPT